MCSLLVNQIETYQYLKMDSFGGIVDSFNKAVKPAIPRAVDLNVNPYLNARGILKGPGRQPKVTPARKPGMQYTMPRVGFNTAGEYTLKPGVPDVSYNLKAGGPKPAPAPAAAPRMGVRMPASGFRAPNIPGAAATKTVLNSPATKGLVKAGGKRIPVVGGLLNAGLATYDVSQGADPLRAYGRAATEMAGGALGAGAAGLLAIPSGPGAAVAAGAGYMGGSTAAGTAFDALFPQTVNPVVPEKKPSSSSSEKAKKVPAGAFGDIVNKFDRSMAPSNVPAGAFGDIVNKFDNAMNPSSAPEIKFELPTFAATGTDTGSGDREVGRSDPRNAEYIKQRSALTADSTDAERKVVQDAGMAAWAKANPGLVGEVMRRGSKQSGYDVIQKAAGLENSAVSNYDADQTFTGKDIKEADRQNLGDSGIEGITRCTNKCWSR